jgi:hypothetical protein
MRERGIFFRVERNILEYETSVVFVWVTRWSPLGVGRDEYVELFTCHVANEYD